MLKDRIYIRAMKMLRALGFFATLPTLLLKKPDVEPSPIDWRRYAIEHFNKPGIRVLEIGSRTVTGTDDHSCFDKAEYVGFDFMDGDNVDVVGDCHRLTSYFKPGEKFDLIFSFAVFEHLHMPWVAAEQIGKMLKVGGYAYTATHFSFGSHERPWHFFQFSDMGLRALFNEGLGFSLMGKGMNGRIVGYFDRTADRDLRYTYIPELYAFSDILVRKDREVEGFDWHSVDINEVVGETRYPSVVG